MFRKATALAVKSYLNGIRHARRIERNAPLTLPPRSTASRYGPATPRPPAPGIATSRYGPKRPLPPPQGLAPPHQGPAVSLRPPMPQEPRPTRYDHAMLYGPPPPPPHGMWHGPPPPPPCGRRPPPPPPSYGLVPTNYYDPAMSHGLPPPPRQGPAPAHRNHATLPGWTQPTSGAPHYRGDFGDLNQRPMPPTPENLAPSRHTNWPPKIHDKGRLTSAAADNDAALAMLTCNVGPDARQPTVRSGPPTPRWPTGINPLRWALASVGRVTSGRRDQMPLRDAPRENPCQPTAQRPPPPLNHQGHAKSKGITARLAATSIEKGGGKGQKRPRNPMDPPDTAAPRRSNGGLFAHSLNQHNM